MSQVLVVLDNGQLSLRRPLAERFWEKVKKGEGCWEWIGSLNPKGYGHIGPGGKHAPLRSAHRVSWELANGPIPDGLWVLHRCDNRKCVRPDHLFLGTRAENSADMTAKGRGTRGERSGMAKLTAAKVYEIRSLSEAGMVPAKLATRFGVSSRTIRNIVSRTRWGHLP